MIKKKNKAKMMAYAHAREKKFGKTEDKDLYFGYSLQ